MTLFFCKAARVKVEVEKGPGHREMEWCQETSTFTLQLSGTVTTHSSNQLSVFSVHLNEAFYQVTRSLLTSQISALSAHCFPAGAKQFAHFGWFRLDLLSSNLKAYNLIMGICCPTVMTTFHMVLTEGPQKNFTGSGVHCKNFSQTYLGFSFSSRTPSSALKIWSGAVRVWILVNVASMLLKKKFS